MIWTEHWKVSLWLVAQFEGPPSICGGRGEVDSDESVAV